MEQTEKKNAIILLSGGLDSTTVLAHAKSLGYRCYCLSFAYGQKQVEELEMASFVESYGPIAKPDSERLRRYRISDPYLRFYFRFIKHQQRKIKTHDERYSLQRYLPDRNFEIWRGLAFEYFCYKNADLFSDLLRFSSVNYECGPWFQRADLKSGAQIDLLYKRADNVITLCEIKYQEHVGKGVIEQVERKIRSFPNPKRMTIEKVLITVVPPTRDLIEEDYFTKIITLDDFCS